MEIHDANRTDNKLDSVGNIREVDSVRVVRLPTSWLIDYETETWRIVLYWIITLPLILWPLTLSILSLPLLYWLKHLGLQ